MACPFFDPLERCEHSSARMPLGDFWRGLCRSENAPFVPDDSTLKELCNMGYARGRCPRCKDEAGDAVRFLIAGETGDLIRIDYAVERDHHPYAQGTLEYHRASRIIAGAGTSILARQVLAYVKSYLRRKPVAA